MRRSLTAAALLALGAALAGCHYHYIREPDPLTTAEILELTRKGTAPAEVIRQIDASRTVYVMTSKDVLELKEQGVDPQVIDHMMRTRERQLEIEARYRRHYHPYYHFHYYPYAGWGWGYCW